MRSASGLCSSVKLSRGRSLDGDGGIMTTPRFSRTEIVDTASLAAATESISKHHTIRQPALIIGTGLLGASIGLGLRVAGIDVLLSDPSTSAQGVAEDIGAGRVLSDADEPGTVIVAAPPDVTGEEVITAYSVGPMQWSWILPRLRRLLPTRYPLGLYPGELAKTIPNGTSEHTQWPAGNVQAQLLHEANYLQRLPGCCAHLRRRLNTSLILPPMLPVYWVPPFTI